MHINLNEDDDDDTTVKDGESVRVSMMMYDSLDPVQRAVLFGDQQQPTLDAYQQFEAGRAAWRKKQQEELTAILDGSGTANSGAALMKRHEAWEKRGEI